LNPQRIATPRDFADATAQINRAFEKIQEQIASAGTSGPVSAAAFAELQAQVNNLNTLSGNITNVTGTGASGPSSGTSNISVTTDESTIGGDGTTADPISLITPVTIGNGGTGLDQAGTQQIQTNGTLIGANSQQVQPTLTLAGVTAKSAVAWSLPNPMDASWLTGIFLYFECSTNTVIPWLVNPTGGSITPVAQLVNIKVIL
jgi:hypothetical protein